MTKSKRVQILMLMQKHAEAHGHIYHKGTKAQQNELVEAVKAQDYEAVERVLLSAREN